MHAPPPRSPARPLPRTHRGTAAARPVAWATGPARRPPPAPAAPRGRRVGSRRPSPHVACCGSRNHAGHATAAAPPGVPPSGDAPPRPHRRRGRLLARALSRTRARRAASTAHDGAPALVIVRAYPARSGQPAPAPARSGRGGMQRGRGGVAGGKVTEHRRLPWRKPAGSGAQRATPQRKRRACPFPGVDVGGGGRPAAARRGRQRPSPKSGGRQFGWDGTGKASRPTRGPCPAVATHCPPPSRRGQHARTTQEPSRSPTHPGGKRGGAGNRGLRSEAGGESAGGGGVAAPAAGKRTPLGLPHRAARGVSL